MKELIVLMLLLRFPSGTTIPLSSFYSYGYAANDTLLPQTDDGSSPAITLPTPFLFYGINYSTIYVNNNGDLSFGLAWTEIGPTPFPITTYPVVAIYQADVDTRGTGRVWYRTTRNATLLAKAANDIHSLTGTSVSLQWLFIATWDHVGYYSYGTDKTNTFQAILATSNARSYALLQYADGLIQWPSSGAQVGFNAGNNMNYVNIPGSRTPYILNITGNSNVGVHGQWVFSINQAVPFCGVLYNYDERILARSGFVKCYDQPYSSTTTTYSLDACSDTQIVFAGTKSSTSSTMFAIGAFGSPYVFTARYSTATAYYDIGGAYWYRYPFYSFGFTNSSSINLNTCDNGQYINDCGSRLCWHLDQNAGGYRAGCTVDLNSDTTWRKVIYKGNNGSAMCSNLNVDACALGISGCSQICTNTYGSYMCSCYSGYQISSNNRSCVDRNECALGISGCAQICNNTYGSYICNCYSGYKISSNSRSCVDRNECALGISGCSQICTNTDGSYMCSCYSGYQISFDSRTCVDIDECALGISECSHICTNTNGSYVCSCYSGYQISFDSRSCVDIDECVTGTNECGQICSNTDGSYLCDCYSGYVLLSDGRTCSEDTNILSGAVTSSTSTAIAIGVAGAVVCGITVCSFIIILIGYKLLTKKPRVTNDSPSNVTSGNQPGVYITQGNFELVNVTTSRPAESRYVTISDTLY